MVLTDIMVTRNWAGTREDPGYTLIHWYSRGQWLHAFLLVLAQALVARRHVGTRQNYG